MRLLFLALALLAVFLSLARPTRASADGPVYLALGDSLAVGVGASDRATMGYVPQLYRHLQTTPRLIGRDLQLVNLAVAGETTTSIQRQGGQLDRAIEQLRSRNGDADRGNDVEVITIDIGGNDVLVLLSDLICGFNPNLSTCRMRLDNALTTVSANLETIFRRLREAAGPGAVIATMTYYNPFSGTRTPLDDEEAADRLNEIIKDAASDSEVKAQVVDVYPLFENKGPQLTHIQRLQPDVHPNDAGYTIIATAFSEVLEPLLTTPKLEESPGAGEAADLARWVYMAAGVGVVAVVVIGALWFARRRRAGG